MARTNKASEGETFYQIRLTKGTDGLWHWAIWERNYRKGFSIIRLPFGEGWMRTAGEAFDCATNWCNQNGIKTS